MTAVRAARRTHPVCASGSYRSGESPGSGPGVRRAGLQGRARRWRRLVEHAAPAGLLARTGVGTRVAATLLVTAGDNPARLRTEASFAALCGVSPVDASSGKQRRHRLNHGGDRQANSALWQIVFTRMATDPRTRPT